MRTNTGYFNAKIVLYLIIGIVVVITLTPFLMMVMNSFKSNDEMYRNPAGFPLKWTLDSYISLFQAYSYVPLNFLNSIIFSVTSTAIALALCSLAAYSFVFLRFRASKILFAMILAMMMVPREIVMPGQYILFAKLRLLDTIPVQILPTITPIIGLFLIRQYMLELPMSVVESAKIDGAGSFMMYLKIVLPMSAPIISAYGVLHFLGVWNNYTWPMLATSSVNVQPIMIVLPQLVDPITGFVPVWGTIMAGCTIATVPFLIYYLKNQDKIISSITIGAVKG